MKITFETIKRQISAIGGEYKAQGFLVSSVYKDNAYKISITKGNQRAVIRDGYYSVTDFNKSEVMDTSFDVLFYVDNMVFANYVSDYPLEEYAQELIGARKRIDKFFDNKYTITDEKMLLLWRRKYLNISVDSEEYHFLGKSIRATSSE